MYRYLLNTDIIINLIKSEKKKTFFIDSIPNLRSRVCDHGLFLCDNEV